MSTHKAGSTKLWILFSFCSLPISATARKCEEKCKEYAGLVYERQESPVLRMEPVFHTVSRCSIIETPLIIGGTHASDAEFPHMAVIGYGKNNTDIIWMCGGTIISDSYILTAAHCLESDVKGPAVKVRVGMTNLEEDQDSMQERLIIDRIKHPGYQPPSDYHDIALLKLDKPLDLNPRVRPACLEIQHKLSDKTAIAIGFGKTAYHSKSGSKDLMKVRLNFIPEEECIAAYSSDIGGKHLPDGWIPNLLCAGVMEGGKDTCQGDSGGPLQRVLAEPYCMYSIVGITSFGRFCAFKNTPAGYTGVSFYLDWIEDIVWP